MAAGAVLDLTISGLEVVLIQGGVNMSLAAQEEEHIAAKTKNGTLLVLHMENSGLMLTHLPFSMENGVAFISYLPIYLSLSIKYLFICPF